MEWMAIKIAAEISKLGSQILAESVQKKNPRAFPFQGF